MYKLIRFPCNVTIDRRWKFKSEKLILLCYVILSVTKEYIVSDVHFEEIDSIIRVTKLPLFLKEKRGFRNRNQ